MITRYTNARVFTGMDGFAKSFVVGHDRFLLVGSDEETRSAYPDAKTIDLGGRFVMAGFNDSHMHLLGIGNMLSMAQLAPCSDSLAHVLDALRAYATDHPQESFVLGRGWNQDFFTDVRRFPNRDDLDAVCPDRPCLITRACGHVAIANSAALRLAGIDQLSVSVDGGCVETDGSGRPTGVLSENAIALVSSLIPKPDRAAIARRLELAMAFIRQFGVTSVQSDDFSTGDLPFEDVLGAYLDLKAAGKMTVRVTEQCNLPDEAALDRFLSAGYCTGWGDEWLRIGPLKLLVDGSLGARTALLHAPYGDAPDTRGIATYTQEALNALVLKAHRAGMQIAIHAIGDAAADMVLDAYEAAQRACPRIDARHGIVHAQVLNHALAARMKELNLHAYIQSIFLDYDTQIVYPRLGERAQQAYPAASLLAQGITLSNGSDSPVELPNALGGVQCAVTRAPFTRSTKAPYLPQEALSIEQALLSYTAFGAHASFEDDFKGLIRAGHLADFIVLDNDPFQTEHGQIHAIEVAAVYTAGKQVL